MNGELEILRHGAGICDLSSRNLLALVGEDRVRFLQGQTTQNIESIQLWHGNHTAFVTNKGKIESDGYVLVLPEEIILDLPPGQGESIAGRLEKFLVADDVEVIEASSHYAILGLVGPRSRDFLIKSGQFPESAIPDEPGQVTKCEHEVFGELYLAGINRGLGTEFDIFIPRDHFDALYQALSAFSDSSGGDIKSGCISPGALDAWRIHCGVPAMNIDFNHTNLPQEVLLDEKAVSYNKGCYVGQEILNRLRAIGGVTKKLTGLKLNPDPGLDPTQSLSGVSLSDEGREVGVMHSCVFSPVLNHWIGLAILKKIVWKEGSSVDWHWEGQSGTAQVCSLPHLKD